jgi:hypothetical protein
MAIHCEKLVKRQLDKHFKAGPARVIKKPALDHKE